MIFGQVRLRKGTLRHMAESGVRAAGTAPQFVLREGDRLSLRNRHFSDRLLAEVKLFLYFCNHIPVPSPSTTPASISVTVQVLAASVGLSRDMAMKALRVLETEKLIICDRPRGRSANQYRICWGTFRLRPPR